MDVDLSVIERLGENDNQEEEDGDEDVDEDDSELLVR